MVPLKFYIVLFCVQYVRVSAHQVLTDETTPSATHNIRWETSDVTTIVSHPNDVTTEPTVADKITLHIVAHDFTMASKNAKDPSEVRKSIIKPATGKSELTLSNGNNERFHEADKILREPDTATAQYATVIHKAKIETDKSLKTLTEHEIRITRAQTESTRINHYIKEQSEETKSLHKPDVRKARSAEGVRTYDYKKEQSIEYNSLTEPLKNYTTVTVNNFIETTSENKMFYNEKLKVDFTANEMPMVTRVETTLSLTENSVENITGITSVLSTSKSLSNDFSTDTFTTIQSCHCFCENSIIYSLIKNRDTLSSMASIDLNFVNILQVKHQQLSFETRKKTSAKDSRSSSTVIGSFAVFILLASVGLIIALDLMPPRRICMKQYKMTRKNYFNSNVINLAEI